MTVPIAVDLDVSQNHLGLPGSITAAQFEQTSIDHIDDVCENELSSVSLHFGHLSPLENLDLYTSIVDQMAMLVKCKVDVNPDIRISGILMNTSGCIEGKSYDVLVHLCVTFGVDHIIVVSSERLHQKLRRDLSEKTKIISVRSSPGVVPLSTEKLTEIRNRRIRRYFYGIPQYWLSPSIKCLRVGCSRLLYDDESMENENDEEENEIQLYELGNRVDLPIGAVPFSTSLKTLTSPTCVNGYSQSLRGLKNHLIAVSHVNDPKECIRESIAGYLIVKEVLDETTMSVLAPSHGHVPSNVLIVGHVEYTGEL
ncbi:hypothetical protein ACOME3_002252 [Neoechinorhynchus agilis]